MEQYVYQPKQCAFHPNQSISNFCKSANCLLPLCPTCISIHLEEHKQSLTYGKFQNINKVINNLKYNLSNNLKQISNFQQKIYFQIANKNMSEQAVVKSIYQIKGNICKEIQGFFDTFIRKIKVSVNQFNALMKQNYVSIEKQIKQIKQEIQQKLANLQTDKVLKTIISYYSKQQQKKISDTFDAINQTLNLFSSKKSTLIIQNNAIQKLIHLLSQLMYLSFQGQKDNNKSKRYFSQTDFTTERSVGDGGIDKFN